MYNVKNLILNKFGGWILSNSLAIDLELTLTCDKENNTIE